MLPLLPKCEGTIELKIFERIIVRTLIGSLHSIYNNLEEILSAKKNPIIIAKFAKVLQVYCNTIVVTPA